MKFMKIRSAFNPTLLALLVMVSSWSCSALRYLDEAQDAFSRGAEIENQANLTSAGASAVIVPTSTYYQQALESVEKALGNETALSSVDLLGSAYILKGLCQWKTGHFEEAKETAEKARKTFEGYAARGIYQDRDYALSYALAGLVEIDMIHADFNKMLRSDTVTVAGLKNYYESSICNECSLAAFNDSRLGRALLLIENAIDKAPNLPELEAYFIQCQLTGLKLWVDMLGGMRKIAEQEEVELGPYNRRQMKSFNRERDLRLPELQGKVDDSIFSMWNRVLGGRPRPPRNG